MSAVRREQRVERGERSWLDLLNWARRIGHYSLPYLADTLRACVRGKKRREKGGEERDIDA